MARRGYPPEFRRRVVDPKRHRSQSLIRGKRRPNPGQGAGLHRGVIIDERYDAVVGQFDETIPAACDSEIFCLSVPVHRRKELIQTLGAVDRASVLEYMERVLGAEISQYRTNSPDGIIAALPGDDGHPTSSMAVLRSAKPAPTK